MNRAESPLTQEFHEFLHGDLIWDKELESTSLTKSEEDNLDSLSGELIQVFSFENLDKSIVAQKENLIQRVPKLGGDNYTCEDLKRDIINIESDDKDKKVT